MKPVLPAMTNKTPTLQHLLGNLELLYVKSKNFHWNVTGVNFHGLHEMFDGIQEIALEWSDTIAERMRSLGLPVCACSAIFLKDAWYPEAKLGMKSVEMVKDMALTLKCISVHVTDMVKAMDSDPITQNKLQDLVADIDKQFFFVNSSLPE